MPCTLDSFRGPSGGNTRFSLHETVLKTNPELLNAYAQQPPLPYFDPRLCDWILSRVPAFRHAESGLRAGSRVTRSEVATFKVSKQGVLPKLVFDFRQINARSRDPPSVTLASVTSLCSLQQDLGRPGIGMLFSAANLTDGFYQFEELARCFSLGVKATAAEFQQHWELGVAAGDWDCTDPDEVLWICLRTISTGSSWALYFCQDGLTVRTVQSGVRRSARSADDSKAHQLLEYRRPCSMLRPGLPMLAPYVDNANVFCATQQDAEDSFKCLTAGLRRCGPGFKDEVCATRVMDCLVVRRDGVVRRVANQPEWTWRQCFALESLLMVRGHLSKVDVGDSVSFLFGEQCCYAILGRIWKRAQELGNDSGATGDEVRRDFIVAKGVMLLVGADLSRRPAPIALCSDSSDLGYALHLSQTGEIEVWAVTRWREYWRLRPLIDGFVQTGNLPVGSTADFFEDDGYFSAWAKEMGPSFSQISSRRAARRARPLTRNNRPPALVELGCRVAELVCAGKISFAMGNSLNSPPWPQTRALRCYGRARAQTVTFLRCTCGATMLRWPCVVAYVYDLNGLDARCACDGTHNGAGERSRRKSDAMALGRPFLPKPLLTWSPASPVSAASRRRIMATSAAVWRQKRPRSTSRASGPTWKSRRRHREETTSVSNWATGAFEAGSTGALSTRCSLRRQSTATTPLPTRRGLLRMSSVGASTARRYEQGWKAFLRFASQHEPEVLDLPLRPPWDPAALAVIDAALEHFLDQRFALRDTLNAARVKLFGTLWHLHLKIAQCPRSSQALRGLARRRPEASRDALTWEETLCLSKWLIESRDRESMQIGLANFLAFDTYARPGEILTLRPFCFVTAKAASKSLARVALVFHPFELGQRAKNQEFDDTILIGCGQVKRSWLSALGTHLSQLPPNKRIFSFSPARWAERLRTAAAATGIPTRRPVPHQLRHGGASLDCINGATMDSLCSRGRWLSTSSCRRYAKHGRYFRRLSLVSDTLRQTAEKFEGWLARNIKSLARQSF